MIRQPMKFHEAEVTALTALVDSDQVVLEQKLDGTRALVVLTPGAVEFYTHGGRRLTHSAASQHFAAITGALRAALPYGDVEYELVLDGEILCDQGTLWLFDVAYVKIGGDVLVRPSDRLADRRHVLETVGSVFPAGGRIQVVRQAQGREEKAALVRLVQSVNAEGVMAKHVDSVYRPGVRTESCLKVKFVRTADVFIIGRNEENTASATLAVTGDDGQVVNVGRCSMLGKPDAQIGEVIEVKYLYTGDGGHLYQPRMMRRRPDKTPAECRLDQFVTYSRMVV